MNRLQSFYSMVDVFRSEYDSSIGSTEATRTSTDITVYEQHHTGAAGPDDLSTAGKRGWILAIEAYHRETKGWSDIFYNVFVFADGEIWEGRHILRASQSSINDAVTVHIPGNNTVTTEAQHKSLLRIARWATSVPARVRDHQQRPAATACSGVNGRITIERLRKELLVSEDHSYQDLGDHPDAVAAEASGLWDGSDPAAAASRSVVAVIAQRALAAADGERGPAGLTGPPGAMGAAGATGIAGPAGPAGRDMDPVDVEALIATVIQEVRRRLRS